MRFVYKPIYYLLLLAMQIVVMLHTVHLYGWCLIFGPLRLAWQVFESDKLIISNKRAEKSSGFTDCPRKKGPHCPCPMWGNENKWKAQCALSDISLSLSLPIPLSPGWRVLPYCDLLSPGPQVIWILHGVKSSVNQISTDLAGLIDKTLHSKRERQTVGTQGWL